jgi:hypothetical protein
MAFQEYAEAVERRLIDDSHQQNTSIISRLPQKSAYREIYPSGEAFHRVLKQPPFFRRGEHDEVHTLLQQQARGRVV